MSPEELLACIGEYGRVGDPVPPPRSRRRFLEAAKNLKVVGRAGIGVDNVDVPQATQKGVVVMNTPFGNATTTAEHAVGMMFALARQITVANTSTQAGKWEKIPLYGDGIDRQGPWG